MRTSLVHIAVTASFAALVAAFPGPAQASSPNLDLDWSTSTDGASDHTEDELSSSSWRDFGRRVHEIQMNDETWRHVLVFHNDDLIAQGYHRTFRPDPLESGTISDVVSYGNQYWMADKLTARYGDPDLQDVRTKREYSQELGNSQLRANRAVDWDLKGERFRWEVEGGAVRYAVRYSHRGIRDHRVLRIESGAEDDYFAYRIGRAFRRAGIDLVRKFRQKTKKAVAAMVGDSDEAVRSKIETDSDELVPNQPKQRTLTTRNCTIDGQSCRLKVHTYGGHAYRVDIDLSSSGRIGRSQANAFEKVGKRTYADFETVNEALRNRFGEPVVDTAVETGDNGHEDYKVGKLPTGQQAFWTAWYDSDRDRLIRHVIHGGQSGSKWHIDHRVSIRLHSVARALAARETWRAEAKQVEKANQLRDKIRKRMNTKSSGDGDDGDGSDASDQKADDE